MVLEKRIQMQDKFRFFQVKAKLLIFTALIGANIHSIKGVEPDANEWVKRIQHLASERYTPDAEEPQVRYQHQVEFGVSHNDVDHVTTITASKYYVNGDQQKVPVVEQNGKKQESFRHAVVPSSVKTYFSPQKRYFDGAQLYKTNTVCKDFVYPVQILDIDGLEDWHGYSSKELAHGDVLTTMILSPDTEELGEYYDTSPCQTHLLPSSYLYSDGKVFYLTRVYSEQWHPIDKFGLPSRRTNPLQVQYVLKTHKTLKLSDGYKIKDFDGDFLDEGFYSIETKELVRKDGNRKFKYSFENTNSGSVELLPPVSVACSSAEERQDLYQELINSNFLSPYLTSLTFLGDSTPTRDPNEFVKLVSLTKKFPNLSSVEVLGRNLMADSQLLLALSDAPVKNPSLLTLIRSCQQDTQYLETLVNSGRISTLSADNQVISLSALGNFAIYLTTVHLPNCKGLIDSLFSTLIQGQLRDVNLEGCSNITNASVLNLSDKNPALEALNLSTTGIVEFCKKEGGRSSAVTFRKLTMLTLNDMGSLLEISLEAPLLTELSADNSIRLDRLTLRSAANLQKLSCQNTQILAADLYRIFDLKKGIFSLNVGGCSTIRGMDRKVLETFSDEYTEKKFYANEAGVNDDQVCALALNTKLTNISLSNNPGITIRGVIALGQNRTLKSLYLDRMSFHETVFLTLLDGLNNNLTLTVLSLGIKDGNISVGTKARLEALKRQNFKLIVN
ncbi:MAG: hypothetical protein FJX03_07900 [Alphaproteobacteria bacterium]|nr:hypothetical protein [Alphaproteobacteria bacterium]